MNRLDFDCPFDLVDIITALLGDIDDDYPVVSVYGKYDVIKELLEDLIMSGVSITNEIELQDYEVSNYDKEFVLYLTKNGVNVEKTWNNGTYYYGGGNISFIHEDCSSKLIKYVDSKTIYEFDYNDENEDECNCDECECACKKDEKPTTTSTSKSTYKINNKEVSKEEFDKKYEEFEEMYLGNIRDMLLNYCEFMDEVNDWRKLFRW